MKREKRSRLADEAGSNDLALYLAAGVIYLGLGVTFPAFLFSWAVAAAYLLVAVWLLPALVQTALR